jgi:hypothetical protein
VVFVGRRSILLFSLPDTRKLRDIGNNSGVVLALDAADQGFDIVIVEGKARLLPGGPSLPATPLIGFRPRRRVKLMPSPATEGERG